MKLQTHSLLGPRAFTLIEALVLVAMLAIVFSLIPCATPSAKARARRVSCINNLKQVGLAFNLYANDHGQQFPWTLPLTSTGTLEFADSPQVFKHFAAITNELITPKVLACPSDTQRIKATNFTRLSNTNLSYFIALDADESKPQRLLSGDRNITGGILSNSFLRLLPKNAAAGWTTELHNKVGNIGLADGSVQQVTPVGLRKQLQAQDRPVIRLAIP